MPLGIVSDSEFDAELINSQSINRTKGNEKSRVVTGEVLPISPEPKGGRNVGDNNVPESLRKLIGAESFTEGRQSALDLAASFGISPSSVSAYSHGATSTTSYNEPNPGLKKHIVDVRTRIVKKAKSRLSSTLRHITDEKLEGAKLRDLAIVAKAMSGVIRDMEPDAIKNNEGALAPQFIVFKPTIINENEFGILHLKE